MAERHHSVERTSRKPRTTRVFRVFHARPDTLILQLPAANSPAGRFRRAIPWMTRHGAVCSRAAFGHVACIVCAFELSPNGRFVVAGDPDGLSVRPVNPFWDGRTRQSRTEFIPFVVRGWRIETASSVNEDRVPKPLE